jgi:hypothetical protein
MELGVYEAAAAAALCYLVAPGMVRFEENTLPVSILDVL